MRKVVANSTPVIALLEIGRLGILKDLYGEIIIQNEFYISDEVYREVLNIAGE